MSTTRDSMTKVVFSHFLKLFDELDNSNLDRRSNEFKEKLRKCVFGFEELTRQVSNQSLFSVNEDINELATSNLKYLQLPAYLGFLSLKRQDLPRIDLLEMAEVYFQDFLTRLDNYSVIPRKEDNDNGCLYMVSGATTSSGGRGGGGDSVVAGLPSNLPAIAGESDAVGVRRAVKVQKYRKQMQLKSQIEFLKSQQGGSIDDDDVIEEGGGDDKRGKGDGGVDEESLRKLRMLELQLMYEKVREELAVVRAEKPLAAKMASLKQQQSETETTDSQHPVKDRQPMPPPRGSLKPVILCRSEAQKKVFGLGYPSVPTMTVEEWTQEALHRNLFGGGGDEEHHYGVEEGHRQHFMNADEEEEDRERREERDDAELRSSRQRMDEYSDTHRRGWGNTKNKG